jgi:hypothetical protein
MLKAYRSFSARVMTWVIIAGIAGILPFAAQAQVPAESRWALGVYGGALTERPFLQSFAIHDPKLVSNYIAAVNVTYLVHRFKILPVNLEIDATVAKRFGQDQQWDFGLVPMLRWTDLPWNDYLYTNVRVGLLGASYATGVSPWELHWAGNDHGSKFLNYLAVELDFKPDATSDTEFFLRSHHRSGIFGAINNTHGGSTYITSGVRWHF